MIKVFIPKDLNFNYKECKKLYKKYKNKLEDERNFSDIVKNTWFFSFFNDNNFIGCIYFYRENDKLFVNAFAKRHTHLINLECFKMSFDWFNCDIYARSRQKTAILCLYKCGFKKIDTNIYKRSK